MASIEELQQELVRQSTKRLETEHERSLLEEQWRVASKELNILRKENASLRSENAALAQRAEAMENDLAELSSSLLDEANQQVSDANKRAAATLKLVAERDAVIESQEAQLQALKEMVNEASEQSNKRSSESSRAIKGAFGTHGVSRSSPAPASPVVGISQSTQGTPLMGGGGFEANNSQGVGNLAITPNSDQLSRDLILDLDSYSSPLRPLMRTDIREFKEFLEVWGIERNSHSNRFGKLESPPWRRTRFVQRVLQEDIEATLRLDRTPHMSWLSCRAFLSGILDKTMTLEPVSPKEMPWRLRPSHPCLLCGENRGAEKYARSYWAIPSPGAEPIVLDLACVAKAQLSCEFVAFLKHIASLPPADTKTQIKAWRQCNTLKEQLFWARIGAMFPDLSDEIWDVLNYSQYNQFDFDTVEDAETINTAQVGLNAVPSSPTSYKKEDSASHSNLARSVSNVSAAGRPPSKSPSIKTTKDTKGTETKSPSTIGLSEATQSDAAQIKKSDPAKSNLAKSDPANPDRAESDSAESNTAESNPVRYNSVNPDSAISDPADSNPVESNPAESDTVTANMIGESFTESKNIEHDTDYDESGQDRPRSPTERFGTPSFAEQPKISAESGYTVPGAWPQS